MYVVFIQLEGNQGVQDACKVGVQKGSASTRAPFCSISIISPSIKRPFGGVIMIRDVMKVKMYKSRWSVNFPIEGGCQVLAHVLT